MPFIALLIASLVCTILALRLRAWWLCLLAFILALPASLVANVNYGGLLLLPCIQLAATVALRWSVGPLGWLGLLFVATGIWFIGAASPFLLNWPTTVYWVLLIGLLAGLVALVWSRVPWLTTRHGPHVTP
jgi:hypothetical protein